MVGLIEGPVAWAILASMFTGGMAFGGFKVALNGTKKRIDHLENLEEQDHRDHSQIKERLTAVETKLDLIYDIVRKE